MARQCGMSGGVWSRSDSEFAGKVPIPSSAAIPTCMSSLWSSPASTATMMLRGNRPGLRPSVTAISTAGIIVPRKLKRPSGTAAQAARASPAASPPLLPLRALEDKTARARREKHKIGGKAARARPIRKSRPAHRTACPKGEDSDMFRPASGKPPYFTQEIDRRKRLRNVSVGALLLGPEAVTRRRFSAHDNDRNALIRLRVFERPADLEAIALRHDDVEQDEAGTLGIDGLFDF